MKTLLVLLLVSMFFVVLPRHEPHTNVRIVEYADLPSERLYAECGKAYKACRADYPRCEIDRDQCVTWRSYD